MKIIKLMYYNIRYIFAVGGVIHSFAQIDVATKSGGNLFFDYTWGERYLVRVEYLNRRSNGIECTFDDVEKEYLDDWKEKFQEAKRKFDEKRKNELNDWWT